MLRKASVARSVALRKPNVPARAKTWEAFKILAKSQWEPLTAGKFVSVSRLLTKFTILERPIYILVLIYYQYLGFSISCVFSLW